MKASELRIGNLVKDGNDFEKVTIYHLDCLSIGRCEFDPIPLTEEWLEKSELKRHHYDYYCDTFMLREIDGNEWIVKYYPEDMGSAKLINKGIILKYVHQLQNLYFALTGEELILNA